MNQNEEHLKKQLAEAYMHWVKFCQAVEATDLTLAQMRTMRDGMAMVGENDLVEFFNAAIIIKDADT